MNENTFPFVIYMIHACANRWNRTPKQVYRKLKDVDCIDRYLVPHYDILHTQGTDYLVDDIQEYLSVRGESV